MAKGTVMEKDVVGTRRSVRQNATLAVRDVYDVATELITNADDRYQFLGIPGLIVVEVERRRGKNSSLLRFRDFADGMTADDMDAKLSMTGGRVSGLEAGANVRGTNSRGAKDVAAAGKVTFESIAGDGRYHRCEISPLFKFRGYESLPVTDEIRESLRIPEGTGTVVTVELQNPSFSLPRHDNLRRKLENLVSLREIIRDPHRTIILRDQGQCRDDELRLQQVDSVDRVKVQLNIPEYPEAKAKLIISRAKKPFDRENNRFRQGGILIKSRHAVHEATLFDTALETDPHALWFTGRLTCEYIDELWNELDDRYESDAEAPSPDNPLPIIDPARRGGLCRAHPFVKALFGSALRHLRPLVEEERKRAESEKASIESKETRRRLNKLERAALKFMDEFTEDEDISRDHTTRERGSKFVQRGYALSPPFAQLVVGQSVACRLNVRLATFPELEVGSSIEVVCLSPEIEASKRFASLEPHPNQEGVLQARWSIKAISSTPATGFRVRGGPISAESTIEVFQEEAEKFAHIDALTISKKKYRIQQGKTKRVRVLAPITLVPSPADLDVSISNRHFSVTGSRTLKPNKKLGVAVCDLRVKADAAEAEGTIEVSINNDSAEARVETTQPEGAGIEIKIEDISLGNQRYRWRKNVLEIAARHPSLARYLGPMDEGFPGQEEKHFRVILAEIVTDAVCAELLGRNIQNRPEDYEDADWDVYYAEFTKLTARFGPIAHKLQCPD